MTYTDCLKNIEAIGLKNKLIADFNLIAPKYFLDWLITTDKIHSLPSLIRALISFLNYKGEEYVFWVSVLNYLMLPEFERKNNQINF